MDFAEHVTNNVRMDKNGFCGVLNQLPVKVLISDFEGKIIYGNEYLKEQLNLSDEKMVGRSVWDLNKDPEAGKKVFFERSDQLKDHQVYSYQAEANFANNATKWLDVKIRAINLPEHGDVILWIGTDIDFVKMMEKDLAKSKARSQVIFDSAVEGIFIADTSCVILNVNPAFEKMFGYDNTELIGKKVHLLIPSMKEFKKDGLPDNDFDPEFKKLLIGITRQFQGQKKDGTFFPLELNMNEAQLTDETLITGMIRDISESRELENQILKVAESERFKIGRELHDGVGQMLSAIGLMTKNLSRNLRSQGLPGADELDDIIEMVQEADQEVRQLSHGLAHIELQHEGLQVALKRMCERFQSLTKTDCHFICSPGLDIQDKMTALHLFRIVQEAIKNAIKHGNANQIKVRLQKDAANVSLSIEDNGIGLFENPNDYKFKGMGLSTMQYRAELLGGNFEIGSTPKGWTQVRCLIPVNR